jgi:hypothetical protein
MHHIPPLQRPRLSRIGNFSPLGLTSSILAYKPHFMKEVDPSKPKRKSMVVPHDNNAFVKPIKQCFVRNPRLMPMTKLMLTLLSGWAGQGGCISTTTGAIGRNLSRCRRQVFRYLQDAKEEGFLTYTRRKDRMGRYIGIRIWLTFAAIRHDFRKKVKKDRKTAENIDVTHKSEINNNLYLNKGNDEELWKALERFGSSMGYELPEIAPS